MMIKSIHVIVFTFLLPLLLTGQVIKEIQYPNGSISGVSGYMVDEHTFLVRGETSDNKTIISKFNLNGDTIWTSIIQGGVVSNTYGQIANKQMTVTNDKGCVFTHFGDVDLAKFNITKLDSLGNLLWTYLIPAAGQSLVVNKVLESSDSGIVLLYKNIAGANWETFLTKMDSNGDFLLFESFSALPGSTYFCSDIYENDDQTFYVSGGGTIIKLDSSLFPVKWMEFNTTSLSFDRILSVINDTITLKASTMFHSSSIFKVDTGGNYIKQITFPIFNNLYAPDVSINENGNQKIWIAGVDTGNVTTIVNVNNQFNAISTNTFSTDGFGSSFYLLPVNIIKSDSRLIAITTKYNSNSGNNNLLVIISDSADNFCSSNSGNYYFEDTVLQVLSPVPRTTFFNTSPFVSDTIQPITRGLTINTVCSTTDISDLSYSEKIFLYPNPTVSELHISGLQHNEGIEIYNLSGLKILNKISSTSNVLVDVSDLIPGLYCVVIGGRFSQRFIKL